MKRLLFCLVATVAIVALAVPGQAAEFKFNGMMQNKYIASDNMDGNKNVDDNKHQIRTRARMYFTSIASENLMMSYRNEIDFIWGVNESSDPTDDPPGDPNTKNKGGGLGGDGINVETKHAFLDFLIPNTPVKFRGGLQGIALHRGWFFDWDVAAARFDINLDPFSILAYYAIPQDTDVASQADTIAQYVLSGAYKAENMDARVSFGYEKGPNSPTAGAANVKSDNFYILMGDFNMSFDLVSFFIIAGGNFGKIKGIGVPDKKYVGTMVEAGIDIALDIATIRIDGRYVSGEPETSDNLGFRGLSGMTYSWAEIPSDGYFWEVNSDMAQIGGANTPNNIWAIQVGADFKLTDTTAVTLDLYYIGMDVKRNLGNNLTNDLGTEIDLDLTQKIYDNLDLKVVGAYMFAGKGYGSSTQSATNPNGVTGFVGDQDNAYILGMGLNYRY